MSSVLCCVVLCCTDLQTFRFLLSMHTFSLVQFSSISISFHMRAWKRSTLSFNRMIATLAFSLAFTLWRAASCLTVLLVSVRAIERILSCDYYYMVFYFDFICAFFPLFLHTLFNLLLYILLFCVVLAASPFIYGYVIVAVALRIWKQSVFFSFVLCFGFWVLLQYQMQTVKVARSNRMNVFWSRNRCSFYLMLAKNKGATKYTHTKAQRKWLVCDFEWHRAHEESQGTNVFRRPQKYTNNFQIRFKYFSRLLFVEVSLIRLEDCAALIDTRSPIHWQYLVGAWFAHTQTMLWEWPVILN